MFTFIKNIKKSIDELTTYNVGLIQTRAYRNLKRLTNEALKPYDLSVTEWGMLGILYEKYKIDEKKELDGIGGGISSTDLSKLLGVEGPFITELALELKNKKIIEINSNETDKRTRLISLTKEGKKLIPIIEKVVREKSYKWKAGLSPREVLAYYKVIKKFSELE